jgi:chromosomal replication initiation ATPase DnaA
VQVTSRSFNCDRDRIIQKGGKRNIARDIAIYLSRKMTAESGVELGRYFGGISGAGITVRYKYIAKKIVKDRSLRKRIEQIKRQIINN